MTDEAKALVERLRDGRNGWTTLTEIEAADLIETQAREIERLRGRKTCCNCDKLIEGDGQGSWICNSCAGAD